MYSAPNIITQLTAFFCIAILLNKAGVHAMLYLLAWMLIALMVSNHHKQLQFVLRFKWFFIVTWLIFAFNTPGEYWQWWPFKFAPTLEGMQTGAAQVLRIVLVLLALSMVLAVNNRQQLVSGFYYLTRPLRMLGLDTERFAVRLWLTLHYVENRANMTKPKHVLRYLRQSLIELPQTEVGEVQIIELAAIQFSWLDKLCTAMMLGLIFAVLWG